MKSPLQRARVDWSVYIVRCADGTLYTGIAVDVLRRIEEHNSLDGLGARYTRTRRPVALVFREGVESRSAAAKRENAIKRLTRRKKELLVALAGRAPGPVHDSAP